MSIDAADLVLLRQLRRSEMLCRSVGARNCKGVLATINISLLTERRRYHCLEYPQVVNFRIRKLTICATLETVPGSLDPENREIPFGPMLHLAGHHRLDR